MTIEQKVEPLQKYLIWNTKHKNDLKASKTNQTEIPTMMLCHLCYHQALCEILRLCI